MKTLSVFDFTFRPTIKRKQLDNLHTLSFLERKENVVFLDRQVSATCTWQSAIAIAVAEYRRLVYYATLADLITSLEEAQQAGHLTLRLRTLVFPRLMVIDVLVYLPISCTGAQLYFQFISRRYEHASTLLTTNEGFEEWGNVFADETMAAALVDRLLHHCHIVSIRGNGYRIRQHRVLALPRNDTIPEPARRPRRQ